MGNAFSAPPMRLPCAPRRHAPWRGEATPVEEFYDRKTEGSTGLVESGCICFEVGIFFGGGSKGTQQATQIKGSDTSLARGGIVNLESQLAFRGVLISLLGVGKSLQPPMSDVSFSGCHFKSTLSGGISTKPGWKSRMATSYMCLWVGCRFGAPSDKIFVTPLGVASVWLPICWSPVDIKGRSRVPLLSQ